MTFSTGTATASPRTAAGAERVSRPRRGPAAGLAVQLILLTVITGTAGLTAAGWLAGAAYGIVLCGLVALGLHRTGMTAMGPANLVTFARALMVGGVTAMVVSSFERPVHQVALVTLVGVALALDGVDGQVARRTGSTTKLGARFDMEVDAFLILVLSVFIAGTFGWWTIAIGAYRYVFIAAGWARPWLSGSLPPRFSRKVVAAVQGVVLVVATANVLPQPVALIAVISALASLTWSFGRDIRWLYRSEQLRGAAAGRTHLPIVAAHRLAVLDRQPLHCEVASAG
ncbi:MAG TPA: CDP-alcohol phosphatidyltransferase family protein [Actinoplanes sp.]|nr:CDP-alcohol phosphatidyltransferase family protein [Actinoplanes sp.]